MNNRYFAFSNGSSALSVEKNPKSPQKAYVGAMQDVKRAGLTAGKNQACPSCNQANRIPALLAESNTVMEHLGTFLSR
ncbi:hypothetical protein V2K23_25910 [Pseudomonas alliivorans]|nr:hypothetical protein [Pseudomonas alliivorans]